MALAADGLVTAAGTIAASRALDYTLGTGSAQAAQDLGANVVEDGNFFRTNRPIWSYGNYFPDAEGIRLTRNSPVLETLYQDGMCLWKLDRVIVEVLKQPKLGESQAQCKALASARLAGMAHPEDKQWTGGCRELAIAGYEEPDPRLNPGLIERMGSEVSAVGLAVVKRAGDPSILFSVERSKYVNVLRRFAFNGEMVVVNRPERPGERWYHPTKAVSNDFKRLIYVNFDGKEVEVAVSQLDSVETTYKANIDGSTKDPVSPARINEQDDRRVTKMDPAGIHYLETGALLPGPVIGPV